jgi:hypothetical protein
MALALTGSVMTNPTFDELGYVLSATFTLLCLLTCGVFAFVMRSRLGSRRHFGMCALALSVSILCWVLRWILQAVTGLDNTLMTSIGMHGLFWGVWCVGLALELEVMCAKSIILALVGAFACSGGIVLATHSASSRISAVTAGSWYMLCLGVQVLFVWLLLQRAPANHEVAPSQVSATKMM